MNSDKRTDEVERERARLFAGLYDVSTRPVVCPVKRPRVQLLNSEYDGDDAAGRRFALLEIE